MSVKMVLIAAALLGGGLAARANLLFSDSLNYPNGCIETDGFWYCYSPSTPYQDAMVTNHLLILNASNHDAVAAPTNGVVNPDAPSLVYASFTINVSKLPSVNGGYFCNFMDNSNNTAAHVFIDTRGTVVPGTYRLGIANYATSITATGATNFPMDLATGITYQVVFNWDETASAQGSTLWINPSSANDQNVYPRDTTSNTYLENMPVSTIGFSQYGGVQFIGDVIIGTQFSDVDTNTSFLPVIGIQPQGTTNYSGNNYTLYTAASGIDVTYQWLDDGVPLTDNGVTVVGSQSDVLNLTNLQNSANYSVVASDAAGSVTSAMAVVSIIPTPTLPFFTSLPSNQTNTIGQPVTLTVAANGTGPISYQWYFSAAGSGVTNALTGATGTSYSFTAAYADSGTYYVIASNSAGSTSSATFTVTVVAASLVPIAYVHNYISNDDANIEVAGGQLFEVQGIVTQFGDILYGPAHDPSYTLYFIQDGTGGIAVFNELTATNVPPAGTLVNVVAPAESYYGEIEMDPYLGTNSTVTILGTNNPLPAPQLLNMPMIVTNTMGAYGSNIQCSLVTLTNVYLSTSSTTYTAPTGNFPTNTTKTLYAWPSTNSYPGETNLEVYVYTYTNALNQLNTNYWGQPIPSFCYQLTGIMGIYSPTEPNLYPTRYADFVTSLPAQFRVGITSSNTTPTLAWQAVVGSTYSVYSATSLLGPWTRTFGLGYYPSIGSYTDTNSSPAKFYRVSSP